jgi:acetolactate synthase I/III small subunit
MKYTLAVLVHNQPGVLNRVTSLFRRRQFNISSLTVSCTENPEVSRITTIFEGDDERKEQMVNQLYKLPDVVDIKELDDNSVSRELLLIKMKNDAATREEIHTALAAYEAKIVDYSRESMVIQLAGGTRRIDNFISLMKDYTILEICRTGVVSLERGGSTIGNVTHL